MVDVGTTVKNRYQVVEHIGRGGMADVWSARDTQLNRMVAIKTIAHGLNQDVAESTAMFSREAQTIAQMEHPHILPIYDFGEESGKLFIVMRYMAGGSLGDVVDRDSMLPKQVLLVGSAIAQALDFAHDQNIVHLDLKPQNVLLDTYQTPYLADFGLATVLDREGRAANPGSGTLMYMAPEQLTEAVIDKRADIYSFAIMLYHMFTGHLPFGGTTPLAFKQLQSHEDLPEIRDLPLVVTDILRRCANQNPELRPARLAEVMNELHSVFSGAVEVVAPSGVSLEAGRAPGIIDNSVSSELLDAVDIYNRAHLAWAGGQGRFLLGVTHFMVMDSYYSQARDYGLEIDGNGYQMLLRGALEYNINLDYWWDQVDDDARRWVCLHAVRSANAPARIRALYRLETLPDDPRPRIPRLVAQALQIEVDEEAKLAALKVLGARIHLMKPQKIFEVLTQYRGRLLTTMTRLDLQAMDAPDWVEAAYSPEIDTLIADIALYDEMPRVREAAGRVIGRIRSKTAVRYLAQWQRQGSRSALKALAFVRDEAPNLPPEVSLRARAFTWLTNTQRRILDRANALTWSFLLALIGGWLGMGWYVFNTFRNPDLFAPQRIVNTLGFGLAFAIFTGVLAMLANEIPSRLRGFWQEWTRLAFSLVLGFAWGLLTWWLAAYMFFQNPQPNWDMMTIGALGLTLGYTLTTMLNLRAWLAVTLTALGAGLPVYFTFHNLCPQFGVCVDAPLFSLSPVALVGLLIGVFAGTLLRMRQEAVVTIVPTLLTQLPRPARITAAALVGLVWATSVWAGYALVFGGHARWSAATGFVVYGLVTGMLFSYALRRASRMAFALTAVATFGAYFVILNPYMVRAAFLPTIDFSSIDALLYFDYPEQLITALIPFALFIAIGGHAQLINRELSRFIARLRARFMPMTEDDAVTWVAPDLADLPDGRATAPLPGTGPLRGGTGPLRGGTGALNPNRVQFDFSEEEDQDALATGKIPVSLETGTLPDAAQHFKPGKAAPVGDDDTVTRRKDEIDSEIARLHREDQ